MKLLYRVSYGNVVKIAWNFCLLISATINQDCFEAFLNQQFLNEILGNIKVTFLRFRFLFLTQFFIKHFSVEFEEFKFRYAT